MIDLAEKEPLAIGFCLVVCSIDACRIIKPAGFFHFKLLEKAKFIYCWSHFGFRLLNIEKEEIISYVGIVAVVVANLQLVAKQRKG